MSKQNKIKRKLFTARVFSDLRIEARREFKKREDEHKELIARQEAARVLSSKDN